MMPQDQMPSMPQDNESQETSQMDMIKQALMKVISDMTAMESDRLTPDDKKPKPAEPMAPGDESSPDADMSGTSEDTGAEDPAMLDSLMGEADKADSDGGMPDEQDHGLPPEIMDVVRKKKAALGQ